MKWYWTVRLYRPDGQYRHTEIETHRELMEIAIIQDFYEQLTGCRMLIEGMSENPKPDVRSLAEGFCTLWKWPEQYPGKVEVEVLSRDKYAKLDPDRD